MAKKPVVLIIRDGWGTNPGGKKTAKKDGNAILLAKTPFADEVLSTYPHSFLSASGMDVGLPDGQMGNSEVGHLNLGAGRIVYQDLTRINKAIQDNTLTQNQVLQAALQKAKSSRLHFIGLVSDGGVHSHQDQLAALTKIASQAGVKDIFIHAITDGRDTSPTGGATFLSKLEDDTAPYSARIATVVGRYFAMDRDKRWDRVKIAWDAIVHGIGTQKDILASEAVAEVYSTQNKTDEFMPPMIFTEPNSQRIRDGDVVIWFNFRADRARELSQAFLQKDFNGFDRGTIPKTHFVTLTVYDETFPCEAIFSPQTLEMTLGQTAAKAGLKQMRIAETEKYPHVTYFFNGGAEEENPGEKRFIIPSPKDVATYDLKPQMSASEVTQTVLDNLKDFDLVILNFANPDMVGHTGVVQAAIKAVETIDSSVQAIVEQTLRLGGKLLITADHGNCEYMRNPDGSPNTAHTTNPVDIIYVADDAPSKKLRNGILADVAPTLLEMLNLKKPDQMTGTSLLSPA
jgi:2,3-bisphosphoglycerate-independent phosphoglycerate mutase